MEPLPVGEFRWMEQNELDELEERFPSYDANGSTGMWLCVDLTYPEDLHDAHGDLPLAPESGKVIILPL